MERVGGERAPGGGGGGRGDLVEGTEVTGLKATCACHGSIHIDLPF